ncbi:methylmalonyl-CoA mutase family protein [Escherichia coli]
MDHPSVCWFFNSKRVQRFFIAVTWLLGKKGLSVAFDLATHRGYDSDNPRVAGDGESGRRYRHRGRYESPVRPDPAG